MERLILEEPAGEESLAMDVLFVGGGPAGLAGAIELANLVRRDKASGRLWVRRHLDDWRKGFERAGRDLDQPIDRIYLQNR